jgi:ubiquinone/menaquinone biosynthesis C-methylase UbiE
MEDGVFFVQYIVFKMNEKNEQTKNYYNGIAQGYKNLYHEEQILKLNYVKNLFPTQGKILDAGCGDGVLNQFISKNCDLYSFDLSSELLKLNSNVSSRKFCGNLTDLSIFENNYFDFISSFSVIQDIDNSKKNFHNIKSIYSNRSPIGYIPDFEKVLSEFVRILKKDGTVCLSFVKFSSKSDTILKYINSKFEIVEEFEEIKDLIFVLKKK